MPSRRQRARRRSKPSGQPRRPPRMRHRTTAAPSSSSSTNAAWSIAPAGFAQRTAGKSLPRRSTAAAVARISVSAVVTKRSNAYLRVDRGQVGGRAGVQQREDRLGVEVLLDEVAEHVQALLAQRGKAVVARDEGA